MPSLSYFTLSELQILDKLSDFYDTTSADPNNKRLFQAMAAAAVAGGKAIIEEYFKGVTIFSKGGSPVSLEKVIKGSTGQYFTNCDLASHRAIIRILSSDRYEGRIPIIFEEVMYTHTETNTYISVDDLDGTGRLIRSERGPTVLTQYVENGFPQISANFDLYGINLFYAVKGNGSWMNGEKISQLSQSVTLDRARVIINGRDKEKEENREYYQMMAKMFGSRLITGLATGSRMMAMLNGETDLMINLGSETLYVWDIGMYLNIVEAGGVVTTADGSEINFKTPGVIPTLVASMNKTLHEEALRFIQEKASQYVRKK